MIVDDQKSKDNTKENETIFDLSKIIAFELRRGDDDAAPPKDLDFLVSVDRRDSKEIHMKIKFDNPGSVSTGSKPDVVVAEIRDAYFFSSTDGPSLIKKGT